MFVKTGSASFQECSFSGNTATHNNVSSLLLNSLIDLFVTLSFFVFVFLLLLHSKQNTKADLDFFTSFFVSCCHFFSFYFIFHNFSLFVLTLCWCLFFFLCSSQGGAVDVQSGSASFQECSFSGNTVIRSGSWVSSFSFEFID